MSNECCLCQFFLLDHPRQWGGHEPDFQEKGVRLLRVFRRKCSWEGLGLARPGTSDPEVLREVDGFLISRPKKSIRMLGGLVHGGAGMLGAGYGESLVDSPGWRAVSVKPWGREGEIVRGLVSLLCVTGFQGRRLLLKQP